MRSLPLCGGWLGVVSRLALLLLPFVALGCGVKQGKVSGQVTYNGAPLPGGWVTFRPADSRQNSVSAAIDEQGNYQAVLPAGEVKVSVDNRELEPRPPGLAGAGPPPGLPPEVAKTISAARGKPVTEATAPENSPPKPSGRYVAIPERYYDAEKSGLEFKVAGGDQKQDLKLMP